MSKTCPHDPDELVELIHSLTEFDHDGGEDGYEASADAMWKAALAAFEYAARRVGATGFQASWAALRFYGEAMHIDGPFGVYRLEDALYPQYDLHGRLTEFIEENRGWLREQARDKLNDAEMASYAAPRVVAHWRKLVAS